MMRAMVVVVMVLAAGLPAGSSELLYDAGAIGRWGAILRPGSDFEALVQPWQIPATAWIDRIGIAIAKGADPNNAGFKVTMTDTRDVSELPGTPVAPSWYIQAPAGASFEYVYVDIQPVYYEYATVFAFVVEPGDAQMYGSVAYTLNVPAGWGTGDGWGSTFRLPFGICSRIYGTPVPEPGSAIGLTGAAAFLALSMRRRTFR